MDIVQTRHWFGHCVAREPLILRLARDFVCPSCQEIQNQRPPPIASLAAIPPKWQNIQIEQAEWIHPTDSLKHKFSVSIGEGCHLKVAKQDTDLHWNPVRTELRDSTWNNGCAPMPEKMSEDTLHYNARWEEHQIWTAGFYTPEYEALPTLQAELVDETSGNNIKRMQDSEVNLLRWTFQNRVSRAWNSKNRKAKVFLRNIRVRMAQG